MDRETKLIRAENRFYGYWASGFPVGYEGSSEQRSDRLVMDEYADAERLAQPTRRVPVDIQ